MTKHARNTFVVHMIRLLASSNFSSLFKVDAKEGTVYSVHLLFFYKIFVTDHYSFDIDVRTE